MSDDCYEARVRLCMPPAPRVAYKMVCGDETVALVLDDGRIATPSPTDPACHFDIYGMHARDCDAWLDEACSCGQVRHVCTRCMRPADGDCLTRTCTEPPEAA